MSYANTIIQIPLDAGFKSDIVWDVEQKRAEAAVHEGKKIVWEFDFGCTNPLGFRLQDPIQWNTSRVAIEHFVGSIWPKYQRETARVSLFRGTIDWIHYLYWDEAQKEHFQRWKKVSRIPQASSCSLESFSQTKESRHVLSLYASEQLSNYLHSLGSHLPEEVIRFATFTTTKYTSLWRAAQILSRERFPHILIDVNYTAISSVQEHQNSVALCLPQDQYLNEEVGEIWESLYIELEKNSILFRVIPETFIAEDWSGLEKIVVLTNSLSEFGKRQLQGFAISGGQTICYGGILDIANGTSWEDWIEAIRGRGI